MDVGNFVHKILEEFMGESVQDGFPLPQETIVSRAERLIRQYIASVSLGRRCQPAHRLSFPPASAERNFVWAVPQ